MPRASKQYRVLEGKVGVKQVYDEMADVYDSSKLLYWTRRFEEGEERVIRKWFDKVSSPVLDVGCGTGRYCLEIASKGYGVMALDISPKMLKKLIGKAKKRDFYSNIHPILADGENLPFIDDSFGSLICTLTFDHFENWEKAAKEFSRVLKTHGLCILTTFNKYTLDDLKRRVNLPFDKVIFQTEKMKPTLVYEIGHTVDEIKEIFTQHKFNVEDVKGCCYWHLLGSKGDHYNVNLDSIFNLFKPLLKYAEIHAYRMKKQ